MMVHIYISSVLESMTKKEKNEYPCEYYLIQTYGTEKHYEVTL